MRFDWNAITTNWPKFVQGTWVTFYVALAAMGLALVVGLTIALMRMSSNRLLRIPALAYVEFYRSLPLYVFLLWMYYGLKIALNLGVAAMETAILSLGLISAAYMAEIFRSGLLAVQHGQVEAGMSVGLSTPQIFRLITFPQMMRIILPATINQFVGVLKGATIAGIIGVADLMYVARTTTALTFQPFELYSTAGVILIVSTLFVATIATLIESRFKWQLR